MTNPDEISGAQKAITGQPAPRGADALVRVQIHNVRQRASRLKPRDRSILLMAADEVEQSWRRKIS